MSAPVHALTATELADQIAEGNLSPVTVVDTFLERIEACNDELNAFITVTDDQARVQAKQAAAAVKSGEETGPLHGVPVAIKDLLGYKSGVKHTFGAKPFADFVAPEDSILVERLESAGAIVIGKTNTPEFGYKSTTDNELIGATANPFDHEKTPGGSSGGSCAALAAGLTPIATGSDIGGSVRIPASACGVVGFYPSFARVPHNHFGDAYLSEPPFLQPGPLARTVEDAAVMLDVIAGADARDPFGLPDNNVSYRTAVNSSISGVDIAYSPDLGLFPIEPAVAEIVEEAVSRLDTEATTVSEIEFDCGRSLDALEDAYMTQWMVHLAEQATLFEREPFTVDLLEHRTDLPEDLVTLVERGRQIDALEYRLTNVIRTDLHEALERVFDSYDVLATPTLSVPPFDKTMDGPETVGDQETHWDLGWVLTWPFNMTGNPALSVPAGFTDSGLPVGVQFIGPRYADARVLAVGAALERVRPWQERYPM